MEAREHGKSTATSEHPEIKLNKLKTKKIISLVRYVTDMKVFCTSDGRKTRENMGPFITEQGRKLDYAGYGEV